MTVLSLHRLLRPRVALMTVVLAPLVGFGQAPSPTVAQGMAVVGTMPEDYLPGLKSVLAEAQALSPRMFDQRIALAQNEADQIAARSALFPHLSGNAGYGVSSARSASADSNSSSNSSGFSYGVSLGQTLFQEGAVKAQVAIAKLNGEIAKQNYRAAYAGLLSLLRSQYLQLILKKAAFAQARRQTESQERQLKYIKESIARQERARSELPAAEAAAETVRLAAERQAQDLENSKRLFCRLAGTTELADAAIPDVIPEPRLPDGVSATLLAGFLGSGVSSTPQAQTYALYVRQSEIRSNVAKYVNWPKVSLGAGASIAANVSSDNAGNVSQGFVQGRNVGVSMTMNFYDAGAARAGKLREANTRRSQERQLRNYLEATRDEALGREKQVGFEFRAMRLAELQRDIQAGVLALDEQYRDSGLRSVADVERSKIAFHGLEIAAFGARASFLQQWADFVGLVGADPMMQQLPAGYLSHGQ